MELIYIHTSTINSEKANLIQVISMCQAFAENKIKVKLYLVEPNDKKYNKEKDIQKINNFFQHQRILFEIDFYKLINWMPKTISYYFSVKKILTQNSRKTIYFVRHPFVLLSVANKKLFTVFESHNNKLHSNFILHFFLKIALKKIHKKEYFLKLISISKALEDYWLKNKIRKEKTFHYHDGFSIKEFDKYLTQTEAKKLLGYKKNDFNKIILYAGSLYPDRGIENISILAEKFPEVKFIVIGGPSKFIPNFIQYNTTKGITNIEYKGKIPHNKVFLYLYAADVLLAIWSKKVKTINYCSPLKIFEYMASGRLIVAQGFRTIREVLKHKDNSFIADCENIDSLVNNLQEALLLDYPNSIAEKARQDALNSYSWDIRAKRIINEII